MGDMTSSTAEKFPLLVCRSIFASAISSAQSGSIRGDAASCSRSVSADPISPLMFRDLVVTYLLT